MGCEWEVQNQHLYIAKAPPCTDRHFTCGGVNSNVTEFTQLATFKSSLCNQRAQLNTFLHVSLYLCTLNLLWILSLPSARLRTN